jgi:hypothetical protein
MLVEIERNLSFVPQKLRTVVEPLIGAMHAGDVTRLSDQQHHAVHRAFVLHCAAS